MGQYHEIFNLDKKERLFSHDLDNGLKLLEQVGHEKSASTALFLLLANSNGRGGGDAKPHELIGSWAGDRILIQGDYAKVSDKSYVSPKHLATFKNISKDVFEMLNFVFD